MPIIGQSSTASANTKPLMGSDINALYNKSLGRNANEYEQDHWLKAANAGYDPAKLIDESPEADQYRKRQAQPQPIIGAVNQTTAQAPQPQAITATNAAQTPNASPSAFIPATTQAVAQTYQSRDAAASNYQAKPWEVNANQTVQDQIRQITGSGSALMQQAETQGLQQANKRGLLNSSIAVGAAQDSLLRTALPIAQQDAGVYAQSAQFNANAANQANAQNAQLQTNVSLSNAQQANQAAATNIAALNAASQFNANAQNVAQLSAVDSALKRTLADITANTQISIADKQYATQKAISDAQNQTNIAISNGDNATKQILGNLDANTRLGLAQIDANTKIGVANIDAKTRNDLAILDNNNRQLLQTNTNAAEMFRQYTVNLANIQNNQNLDLTAKNNAITTQLNALKSGLQAIGEVSKLDLSKYFIQATNQAAQVNPADIPAPSNFQTPAIAFQGP